MNAHIDDDAILYALGALEDAERARVDEHARDCAQCAQRLGEAEVAVADIEQGRSVAAPALLAAARKPRRVYSSILALAAAVAFALLAGAGIVQNVSLHRTLANTNVVLAVLASSHFNHVSFVPVAAGAPVAKAIYGRHGEWLYVIANTSSPGLTVTGSDASGEHMLGSLESGSNVQTLFVRASGRLRSIELRREGRIIGRATPAYSK